MLWLSVIAAVVAFLGASAFFGAPYVPSRRSHVEELFDKHYKLHKADVVVDFGSGDGLVAREVAKRGVRAIGLEIHPLFYVLGVTLSRRYGSLATFRLANIWTYSLPDETTIVYAFSVSRDVKRMYRRIHAESRRLGRPLTFICYGPSLDGVEPNQVVGAYKIYKVDGHSSLQLS